MRAERVLLYKDVQFQVHLTESAAEEWCGNFQGHRCTVRQAGRYFHICSDGTRLYEKSWSYAGDFREGSAVVHEGNRATHITNEGSLLHGLWYEDLDVYHKGLARAKEQAGWMHIDELGHPHYARRFKMVEPFYNGQARVQSFEGAWEVIDESGQKIVSISDPDAFGALSWDLVGFWKTFTLCAAVELGVPLAVRSRRL